MLSSCVSRAYSVLQRLFSPPTGASWSQSGRSESGSPLVLHMEFANALSRFNVSVMTLETSSNLI